MSKGKPYKCPVCKGEHYYGRIVFPGDELPVYCPNHKAKVRLVPVAAAG